MMTKELSLENLVRDLTYIVFSTHVHQFLFELFPPRESAAILEPGCGSAKFSLSYALKGCHVWGIDIDPQVIEYAHRLQGALSMLAKRTLNIDLRVGDIHHLEFPDHSFDLVFNEGVSQHWPDEEKRQGSINEMTRVSRDMVIIIGNNGLNPEEQRIDREFRFGYCGMPPTRKCFTPLELEDRMTKAGLFGVRVRALDATLIAGYGRKHG